jgi:hypothetical protein
MATTPSSAAPPYVPTPPSQREIRVYSHSPLFYWWPVWAVGCLMAVLTFVDGHRMIVVPHGSEVDSDRTVSGHEGTYDVVLVPKGKLPRDKEGNLIGPRRHMAASKNYGVVFASVLLLIIVVSSVPLRGLWSLITVLLIVLFVVLFALLGWWDIILEKINLLDVRVNAGGYLFIALVLFTIWAVTIFGFDRRTYVVVTPGQVRVCQAVGAGETVYDTTGMTFQKQQNDLFRHWIVGLGSGDLIMHRSSTNQEIDMPNVLFIAAKVRDIEQLIKERPVV